MIEIWPWYCREIVNIWPRYGQVMARYCRDMAKIKMRYGWNTVLLFCEISSCHFRIIRQLVGGSQVHCNASVWPNFGIHHTMNFHAKILESGKLFCGTPSMTGIWLRYTGWIKKRPPLSLSKNLCMEIEFGRWKLVLVGKNTFLTNFILWSKSKMHAIMRNCQFWKQLHF